ncbi:MAG: hypothetical protein F6K42_29105 [Leptolyngbya sp. SIO1D8]|nr:hypothetical protein [Leptolyngbya sp. SIO1D8]
MKSTIYVLRAAAFWMAYQLDKLGNWMSDGFPSRLLYEFLIATEDSAPAERGASS